MKCSNGEDQNGEDQHQYVQCFRFNVSWEYYLQLLDIDFLIFINFKCSDGEDQ
mgnify:CR=1 FL=1